MSSKLTSRIAPKPSTNGDGATETPKAKKEKREIRISAPKFEEVAVLIRGTTPY
jgi:hypothetical protein